MLASRESIAGQEQLFEHDSESDVEDVAEVRAGCKRKAVYAEDADDEHGALEDTRAAVQADTGGMTGQEHESLASDVEMDSGSDADDTSSGADANGPDAAEEDQEHARLSAALAEIVQTQRVEAKTVKQEDDRSGSDEEMDDEAMFALDESMARVFRERLKQKRAVERKDDDKAARSNMVHFKNRVLDLLDIYIKQEHSTPRCLTVLMPLLALMRTTRTKQLSERASSLVRSLSQRRKGAKDHRRSSVAQNGNVQHQSNGAAELSSDAALLALLRDVHDEASRGGGSRPHGSACSLASLLLVRQLVRKDGATMDAVAQIYGDTQHRWFVDRKRNLIHQIFFLDWLNWGAEWGRLQVEGQQKATKEQLQGKKPGKDQGKDQGKDHQGEDHQGEDHQDEQRQGKQKSQLDQGSVLRTEQQHTKKRSKRGGRGKMSKT